MNIKKLFKGLTRYSSVVTVKPLFNESNRKKTVYIIHFFHDTMKFKLKTFLFNKLICIITKNVSSIIILRVYNTNGTTKWVVFGMWTTLPWGHQSYLRKFQSITIGQNFLLILKFTTIFTVQFCSYYIWQYNTGN